MEFCVSSSGMRSVKLNTPTKLPASVTASFLILSLIIIFMARAISMRGSTVIRGSDITFITLVSEGSLLLTMTRFRMSRSVRIPVGPPFSLTITHPIWYLFITCAAFKTKSPESTVLTRRIMTSSTLVGMCFSPVFN